MHTQLLVYGNVVDMIVEVVTRCWQSSLFITAIYKTEVLARLVTMLDQRAVQNSCPGVALHLQSPDDDSSIHTTRADLSDLPAALLKTTDCRNSILVHSL